MLYRNLLRPLLFSLPPETAHELSLHMVSLALGPRAMRRAVARHFDGPSFGALQRFGLSFRNPVGLAAGFDKNGTASSAFAALGFGFVEVGTVTNQAQPGNPKPRLFRLPQDRALINRAGFNNYGAKAVVERLVQSRPDCVLGVNIGKSRSVEVEDAIPDYLASFEQAYRVADYIAVNVSSPNTPNLRELQKPAALGALLSALQQKNNELNRGADGMGPLPILLKIAPDLVPSDLETIVETSLANGIAGIIATNTTVSREGLRTSRATIEAIGQGGLSGRPLASKSTAIISRLYNLVEGKMPIVGVGGIFTAQDAWEKICAGASLVQLYTGFIYEGPTVVSAINQGLSKRLKESGAITLDQVVGTHARSHAEVL
jgi:dihydroorotate dehydrogenase